MKINKIKINGFGKISQKEIELDDNINIISGNNEAGKSSLLKFISCMFYGASKNKNGKEISDFDKYKPWHTEEFSGKIQYTLDNGKQYEVYRDFKKKNPVIYDNNQQDISKDFEIDKSRGIEFFTEQTGIDEETFFNTAISEQEGTRLSKNGQNGIIQKLSNMASTGDDNISYKKSFDRLSKMQIEKVGTERSSQRPLNIITNKINELNVKRKALQNAIDTMQNSISSKDTSEKELTEEKEKNNFLKNLKSNCENNRIKIAEVNVNKNLEKEYEEKIEFLNEKIDENAESNIKKKKINFIPYYIVSVIFVILGIALYILLRNVVYSAICLIPVIICIGIAVFKNIKNQKEIKVKIDELSDIRNNISKEIKILTETKENKKKEYEQKYNDLMNEIEANKDKLKKEYISKVNANYVLEALEYSYEEINQELEDNENRIHTLEFKLHTIRSDIESLNTQIEECTQVEEEIEIAVSERDNLLKLNNSFELAKECLQSAYEEVKQSISPKFTKNLGNTIKTISNNKYVNVKLNDIDGLVAEVETGEYLPINRLSTGTIDQMYLALRLSALSEISNEKMPIILDETFAYFDDERLCNILQYIKEEYSEYQILIFTCSDREKEALDKVGIKYYICKM